MVASEAQKSWEFFKAQTFETIILEKEKPKEPKEPERSATDIMNDQVFHAQLKDAIKDKGI